MANITSVDSIILSTVEIINKVDIALNELSDVCLLFSADYESYANKSIPDSSVLKERMKLAVIQAVADDIK